MIMTSKKLEEFAKIVAWFDSARWSEENQKSFSWQPDFQLSTAQEILVHWLTYITDIQRPWQHVWNVGRPVFREIVKAYSVASFQKFKDIDSAKLRIQEFLDKFRVGQLMPGQVRTFAFSDLKYTPRYPNQHGLIERTLTILTYQYERDFIKFLGESIKRWEQNSEGLSCLARDLFLLTYSPLDLNKTVDLLNEDGQKAEYPNWNRFGYKRLWAALRDYRKMTSYLELIEQAFHEVFGQKDGDNLYDIWTKKANFGLDLLELPGDVWNIKFMQKVVKPLADDAGLNIKKSWKAPRIARGIYWKMGTTLFYPEQLDISFDLSSKACANEACDLCPFSGSDLNNVCLSNTSAASNKYCPVALATYQYRILCNPDKCSIKNRKKGLCTEMH
jgi:hypothetical protein